MCVRTRIGASCPRLCPLQCPHHRPHSRPCPRTPVISERFSALLVTGVLLPRTLALRDRAESRLVRIAEGRAHTSLYGFDTLLQQYAATRWGACEP